MSKQDQANDQKGEGMTAAELNAIVKDVPREALPFQRECFSLHHDGSVSLYTAPPMDGREPQRNANEACLMCEASMVRHLLKTGTVIIEECNGDYTVEHVWACKVHAGQPLVAALAAACKEVAQ